MYLWKWKGSFYAKCYINTKVGIVHYEVVYVIFKYLGKGQLGWLTQEHFLMSWWIRMVLVFLKPFDEWYGSLRGELVTWRIIGHFWDWVDLKWWITVEEEKEE